MRVLHVTPIYIPAYRYGGPIHSIHGLCKALVARGHEVEVLTTSIDGPDDTDVPYDRPVVLDGVTVHYFRAGRLRRVFRAPGLDRAVMQRAAEFDLLHIHGLYTWTQTVAARAARRSNVPYVVAPRGMLVKDLVRRKSRWKKTGWIALFDRKNLERASALHLTSSVERDDVLCFGFDLPTLAIVPNAVELPSNDALPAAAASPAVGTIGVDAAIGRRPLVVYLGRISWKKGLDRLVRAMRYVPGATLVVAGNDEERYTLKMQTIAESEGVADRIAFTGFLGPQDKRSLLQAADLLALSSYNENFGNVVLEAMAEGCPVVVSPEVGAAEVVIRTGAGLVIPGDPAEFGPAIAALLDDPERRLRMGRAGRDAAEREYTWPAVAEQMEAVYRDLLR